jgi:hypothetical protein
MSFDEGALAAPGEDPVDDLARVGQAEREQIAGHQIAGQARGHVAEIDLRLMAEQAGLRHKGYRPGPCPRSR